MLGISLGAVQPSASAWWPTGTTFAIDAIAGRALIAGQTVPIASALPVVRASAAYALDRHGQHRTFDEDVPARTNLGLWLEPSSTELVTRNTFSGVDPARGSDAFPAGWSVVGPNSDFAEILPTEIVAGVPTQPLRINGGGAESYAGFRTSDQFAYEAGKLYTLSIYARHAPDKEPMDLYWYTPLESEGVIQIVDAASLTAQWQRFDVTSIAGDDGVRELNLIKTATLSADHAIDFAFPMLREGPAGSLITTTGTSVTRAADFLSLDATALGLTTAFGVIVMRCRLYAPEESCCLISLAGDDAAEDRVTISADTSGNVRVTQYVEGALEHDETFDDLPLGQSTVLGVRWGPGGISFKLGDLPTETVSDTAPSSLAALFLGSEYDGSFPSRICIERLVGYAIDADQTTFEALVSGA